MFLWCSYFFFFKQKTAYDVRISDWSSDVCASDLLLLDLKDLRSLLTFVAENAKALTTTYGNVTAASVGAIQRRLLSLEQQGAEAFFGEPALALRSEEHTSELQSLMRISYAVFCLKKKKTTELIIMKTEPL